MIYITGDTHGLHDADKILKLMPFLTKDDYLIALGDFGICWDDDSYDKHARNFWQRLPCEILFIDGNHENFKLLNAYPTTEKYGGKVAVIGDNITRLMRGQVFTIEGKKFFTMGGAASHDVGAPMNAIITAHVDTYWTRDFRSDFLRLPERKRYGRIPDGNWWREEIPNPDEIADAYENLAKHDNKVDYVLTHSPATQIYGYLGYSSHKNAWGAPLISFLDLLEETADFKRWYFGHMHKDFVYDDKHIGVYNYIHTIS